MTELKIATYYHYPPIPIRSHDWGATYDTLGEDSPQGWGTTEAEAVADLRENYPMVGCPLCGDLINTDDGANGCRDFHCPMKDTP